MPNGLKQGFPLSPLLFILALDPLLTALARKHDIQRWPFADDVDLGFSALHDIQRALQDLECVNAVFGLTSSHTKTFLVSTHPVSTAALAASVPQSWQFIRCADAKVYLGIKLGRNVTARDIF